MQKRRFIQCDVFSPLPTRGNGLAVVVDGEGLADEQMQTFAAWTNLAETTFILPPESSEADYKLKIFTTTREMLFAGHPTLGSCAAWLHSGGKAKQQGLVKQECGIGIVDIDISNKPFAFVAPPTQIRTMQDESLQAILQALDISPGQVVRNAILENGPVWHAIQLESAEQVLALDALRVKWPEFKAIGMIGAHDAGHECDYEVRMLAPSSGMSEDPITGSLNSALAHWLQSNDLLEEPLKIAQGTKINRHGRVAIRPQGSDIFIGGDTHIVIDGHVFL